MTTPPLLLLLLSSEAWAQLPPVVADLDCAGLAESRHSLIITGLTGHEVASAVIARTPQGRTKVLLSPSSIPAQAVLVGAHCNIVADIDDGDLLHPFAVRLSDRAPTATDPTDARVPLVNVGLALTDTTLRTPQLLGELFAQAQSLPPGNRAEALLARVPRLQGTPLQPLIDALSPDGDTVTALVGPACGCPKVPPGARATATRIGDVLIISPHDGPYMALALPGDPSTVAQIVCGCAPAAPLWFDERRRGQERRDANEATRRAR